LHPIFKNNYKEMKITKKLFSTAIVCCLCVNCLFAGGILTNTNQSAHFLRNPARGASMEIDAVYTNPAGLAKLSRDGFHFTLNNQSAFQTRTITSAFRGFSLSGGDTKVFEGKTTALVIPSFMAAYKTGDWVFSGSVAIVGGGGSLTFDKGLPSFEALVLNTQGFGTSLQIINSLGSHFGISPQLGYSLDMSLKGNSMILGTQLGATYAINDMFSVFAGARLAFVNNGYVGYLNNVRVTNANEMRTGLLAVANQLENAGQLENVSTLRQAAGNILLLEQGVAATNLSIDVTQKGMGITPIIGFNFNWDRLNVGVKYEFITKIEVENSKESINSTPMADFDPGVRTPHDIPAFLAIGAQYDILPCVTISTGYHHFFDSNAKMANNKQEYINGGINEFLLGAEWRINPKFLVSAGGQLTRSGVTDNYQTDLSYSLNSYSIGFGGAMNVTEKVRINAGYFFTVFEDWTDKTVHYGYTPPMNTYARTNNVFGVGVDFRF
jgi:long-chain fatty acid transport protein